jgi:hypothetical protein
VPLGVALAELSPIGVRALVAAAQLLAAPEGLGASVLLRRGMLQGVLALLAPAHVHAVVSAAACSTTEQRGALRGVHHCHLCT